MGKSQKPKKNEKKKPAKTMKEKKQAKREKKNEGKNPLGISGKLTPSLKMSQQYL